MLLVSCGSVQIKNAEFCGDEGVFGATCAHTLTEDTRDIPQPEWNNTRFGWICEDSNDFTNLKAELEKLCHVSNQCTYEMQKKIDEAFARLERIKQKISTVTP